jgi:hypothetical protein
MNSEVVSHILAICVGLGVGIPILVKGWRTGDVPARLMGAALTFDGFEWLCWALCAFTPAYGTPLGEALAIGCRLGISAAIICMLLFTRIVFRPESRAAAAWVALLVGAMVVGFFGSGTLGDWGGWRNDHVWNWLELSAQVVGYGWVAVESLTYYAKMKRRSAHGMADPVVTNRLLLWGVYASMYCASQTGYGFALALFEDLTELDTLLGALTITGQLSVWLAFFPPQWYASWLRSGQPQTA